LNWRHRFFRENEAMERPSPDKRRELTARYLAAIERTTETLYRADPIGIADSGAPADEYSQEAQLILARADEAKTPSELAVIVREVFAAQFGDEEARQTVRYAAIAHQLWPTIQELLGRPSL
jgi:hypothetical protein